MKTKLLALIFAAASLVATVFSQSTSKELTNSHGEPIDTETERAAFRKAINAEKYTAGFYDAFDDLKQYPSGSTVNHLTTMPLFGSAWRKSETVPTFISGGALKAPIDAGLTYLGSSVPTKNDGTFSLGFEFTNRTSHRLTGVFNGTMNVSFDSNEMIPAGGGITPAGVVHCNFDLVGIQQLDNYGTAVTFQGEADDDTLTMLAAADFLTGELVSIGDDPAAGTQMPTGLTPTVVYYAILVPGQPNKIKLASTRALALAGTAVDLTTDGTSALNTVMLAYECLNRVTNAAGGGASWLPQFEESRSFQGATSDYLSLGLPHGLALGDAVRVEGTGLPAPLVSGVTYYAVTDAFNRQLRLATTRANALASTAIDLTTAGSAEQGVYYTNLNSRLGGSNAVAIATDRKYLMIVEVEGTTVSYNLVGVGVIKYHHRHLPNKVGATTHFWLEPGGASISTGYREVFDIHSVFAEAPAMRDKFVAYYAGGPASMFAGGGPYHLKNSLTITNGNRMMGSEVFSTGVRLSAGATSVTALGGGALRFNGGHIYAEGGFIGNLGTAGVGGTSLARAVMAISTVAGPAYPLASAAGAETTLKTVPMLPGQDNGNGERWIIQGNLSGAGAKRIRLDASVYGNLFFDSNRAQVFTANAATDVCTVNQHNFADGDLTQLTTSFALPGGLSLATDYFIIAMTPNTFKLATTYENSRLRTAVDITTDGAADTQTITAMPLNGISGAYEIHLYRGIHASASHCISAKMFMPNGRCLPMRREPANLTTNSSNIQIKTTTAEAGGVTIDGVCREAVVVINN